MYSNNLCRDILIFVTLNCCITLEAVQGEHSDFLLPHTVYGVPGIEMNIYFDNLVSDDDNNYEVEVNCLKGIQLEDCWTFMPTTSDVNEFMISFEFKDLRTGYIKKGASQIIISPKDTGAGKNISLLIIGDSLTRAGTYPDHLYELCRSPDEPNLCFVGNNKSNIYPQIVHFEGYGGWTSEMFATKYFEASPPGQGRNYRSPFVFKNSDGSISLDYTRYCLENNNGKAIDIVLIFLGCNDIFDANDDTIEYKIDSMLSHYDKLVAMAHRYNPHTVVGLLMPIPPAYSQDAFGYTYQCGQTRCQYKRNQSRLVLRLLEQYENRHDENIFIIPTHLNLDVRHSFPLKQVLANSRTNETISRQANGVHPDKSGYFQIGDTVYAWLKSILNRSAILPSTNTGK